MNRAKSLNAFKSSKTPSKIEPNTDPVDDAAIEAAILAQLESRLAGNRRESSTIEDIGK